MKQVVEHLCREHETVVITRKRGQPVVLMSLGDFNSINETIYLLGPPSNASKLRKSVEQHKNGLARPRTISLDV